ncbi:Undecaprenyl-phosphate galactose phosphotransferase WbaP/exopolysaccharide biosynthesis polyprenyl glycosylphosphotransferase [Branchiibius hedensis]|uniref:Undecaprenyl-phosphate galactose phosphotransferase, WbaP/exopolysaccharide biosynthesis polyprenyl glycosylphosphotransferase n=1 Tax=Branchiibius hedensis TaxID=672460 RepID=A0A2Y8ZLE8_9MICO|nr:sugar transferase [Branchiibius hedensis]PWJ24444.1 Undecaprenyl-phosphate galactose phosphotransferase WbaP/exopolysaccharide biosynthesis polyprenyl glycosylphosphotransferase [Branchiibius hedensis]SSA33261.1 Undecaprenyl-phosphate galactose phosphotransferase, WbaP/exopolysaccharide biosynthesis polyprenyl glycosylphosphotransferase [Branchiibius hedensis]
MSTATVAGVFATEKVKAPVAWRSVVRARLVTLDAVLVTIAVACAFVLRFGQTDKHAPSSSDYLWVSVALVVCWMVSLWGAQTYRAEYLALGSEEFRRVIRATFSVFGLFAIVSMVFKLDISRSFLAVALPLGLCLLLVGRAVARMRLNRQRGRGRFVDPVLVIGAPQEVRYVAQRVGSHPAAGYRVAGVATGAERADDFELSNGEVVPDIGAMEGALASAKALGASGIIVAGQSRVDRGSLRQLSWSMEGSGLSLALASRMTDVAGPRIHWRPIEGLPLMSVEMPRYSGVRFAAKRAFDLVASVTGLLILSPLLLAIAVVIKFDSPGPVFFRQTRVGVNGSKFQMIKFRSMCVDAEDRLAELQDLNEGHGALFKLRDDPRVTRVGAFLRKYSLDELPQLFNVVIGDMSLVGPRPPLPSEVESYEAHVKRRLNVKPGITGPWQVGGRSNLTWEETVRKDLYYVENWSLAGDILILIKTVRAVLMRDGAY